MNKYKSGTVRREFNFFLIDFDISYNFNISIKLIEKIYINIR